MAVRPIRIVGDPVLHTPTRLVTEFGGELHGLVDDMFDTIAAAQGVGVAANQIGVDLRLSVFDFADEEVGRRRGLVVDPVRETSGRPRTMPDPDDDWEGCLSVSVGSFPTGGATWAQVIGVDTDGTPVSVAGTGLLARCLQHETDHLDGILYLNRL